jgi:hypothetical protein
MVLFETVGNLEVLSLDICHISTQEEETEEELKILSQ